MDHRVPFAGRSILGQVAFLGLACVVAYRKLYVTLVCLGCVAAILVVATGGLRWAVAWTLSIAWAIGVLHWTLLLVHEVGHLLALRAVGLPVEGVRIARYQVILLYRGGSAWACSAVSLAGPVAAFVTGALLTVGLLHTWSTAPLWSTVVSFSGSSWPIELSLPLLMGLEHLVSLGPWAPDGKILWNRSHRLAR